MDIPESEMIDLRVPNRVLLSCDLTLVRSLFTVIDCSR